MFKFPLKNLTHKGLINMPNADCNGLTMAQYWYTVVCLHSLLLSTWCPPVSSVVQSAWQNSWRLHGPSPHHICQIHGGPSKWPEGRKSRSTQYRLRLRLCTRSGCWQLESYTDLLTLCVLNCLEINRVNVFAFYIIHLDCNYSRWDKSLPKFFLLSSRLSISYMNISFCNIQRV